MIENTFIKDINGKHINFLIGSGINMPDIPTLSMGGIPYSFEELLTHNDIEENSCYHDFLIAYFYTKILAPGYIDNEMISLKLTKKYEKFINQLLLYLTSQSNDKPKRINIFTTNYDLMFENSFDKISFDNNQILFNDGSYGFINRYNSYNQFHMKSLQSGVYDRYSFEIPTINLIKLHGSLSWEIENSRIKVNYKKDPMSQYLSHFNNVNIVETIDNKLSKLLEKNTSSLHSIKFPTVAPSDLFIDENDFLKKAYPIEKIIETIKKEIDKLRIELLGLDMSNFMKVISELPVVMPTKNKFEETVFQQHYYQMLRILSQEMERKQTALIIFGFSFNDEHILEIVKRSAFNDELMIYIISFSESTQNQLKDKFKGYANIKHLPNNIKSNNGNFDYLVSLLRGEFENES